MNSDLGEYIPFEKPVPCTGGVEFWLNSLLQMVRDTVRNVLAAQAQCLSDPEYDFIAGFVQYCGQVNKINIIHIREMSFNHKVPCKSNVRQTLLIL